MKILNNHQSDHENTIGPEVRSKKHQKPLRPIIKIQKAPQSDHKILNTFQPVLKNTRNP